MRVSDEDFAASLVAYLGYCRGAKEWPRAARLAKRMGHKPGYFSHMKDRREKFLAARQRWVEEMAEAARKQAYLNARKDPEVSLHSFCKVHKYPVISIYQCERWKPVQQAIIAGLAQADRDRAAAQRRGVA